MSKIAGTMTVGPEPTADQRNALREALDTIIEIHNELPEELRLSLVVSFMTTFCMAMPDPPLASRAIADMIREGVDEFESRPSGHG